MATPLNVDNNLSRFNRKESGLYDGPPVYNDAPGFLNFGFRQPFVFVRPNDSSVIRHLKSYDSRAFPIGSTAQDVVRIGKFLGSGNGILFLATQAVLQGQNAFNETALYNPLEVGLATIRPASLGLVPRPQRHIDISGTSLGVLQSIFGFGPNGSNSAPPGTAGTSALPTFEQGNGRGLLRARTAAKGKTNVDLKWNGTQSTEPSSFLTNLVSSFAPALSPLPSANSGLKRADEDTSDLMLKDLKKEAMSSRLNPKIPTNVRTSPKEFKQNYDSETVFKEKTNLESTNSESKLIDKLDTLNPDGVVDGKSQFPEGNRISQINQKLQDSLGTINGKSVEGVNGSIKTYQDLSALNSNGRNSPGSKTLGGFESSLNSTEDGGRTLDGVKKGFAGSRRADSLNSKGVLEKALDTDSDQILFYFEDVVNNKFLPFRATINGLNESKNPDWQDIQYMGRADKIFVYRGFVRDLSFNFVVYANSITELQPMWQRINYLMGLTDPSSYTDSNGQPTNLSGFIVPPFVKIRIGDMYKNQPAVIKSIGLSVPEDASWETLSGVDYSYLGGSISVSGAKTGQYPTRVEISIAMSLLEKKRAETNILHYDDLEGGKGFGESLIVGGPSSTPIPGGRSITNSTGDGLGQITQTIQNAEIPSADNFPRP